MSLLALAKSFFRGSGNAPATTSLPASWTFSPPDGPRIDQKSNHVFYWFLILFRDHFGSNLWSIWGAQIESKLLQNASQNLIFFKNLFLLKTYCKLHWSLLIADWPWDRHQNDPKTAQRHSKRAVVFMLDSYFDFGPPFWSPFGSFWTSKLTCGNIAPQDRPKTTPRPPKIAPRVSKGPPQRPEEEPKRP